MKIPIKINGKSYKVAQVCDLNTREFITVSKIKGISAKDGQFDTVKYIAWYLKLDTKEAFFATMPGKLHRELSYFPDVEKGALPILSYIDPKKTIQTVGQRFQVEESSLKGYELAVFILAVTQAESNNIDDVNKLFELYMDKPAVYILSYAFFFSKIYKDGKSIAVSFSLWLLGLIRILKLRSRRDHKN